MNEQERKQMIEDFIKKNENDKKKVSISNTDKYEENRKALKEGRATMLWTGKKWECVRVNLNETGETPT